MCARIMMWVDLFNLGKGYSMEGVREHRVMEAKRLMALPRFCGAIQAIRDRLKLGPEELRDRVRVFVTLDGTPAYSLLEKHLKEINPDIAPRWFREEIRGLLRNFSLRSWWWEEWLVRYVLFDEERIPDKGYNLGVWAGPTGQDELYIRVDLEIPGVDQALGEMAPVIKLYRWWVTGPHTQRLRPTPKFERDLDWWARARIHGQSPEEIAAEWQERTEEEWDREMRMLKEQGMKKVEAHDHLAKQWEKTGRSRGLEPDTIRLAIRRMDERLRDRFGEDLRNLGHTMSDA